MLNLPSSLRGEARRRFISRDGVVPKPRTTPSARNKVASRLFIDRAATPPNLGGEFLFGCFTTFGIILISSMRPFCAARSGGLKLAHGLRGFRRFKSVEPFNELKARMTGPNAMSFGQAVHVLRPNTPERQAHQEAKLAEKQAKETEKAKPNRSPRNQQPPEAQKLHAFAPLLPGFPSTLRSYFRLPPSMPPHLSLDKDSPDSHPVQSLQLQTG